jgi:hypothetical protein
MAKFGYPSRHPYGDGQVQRILTKVQLQQLHDAIAPTVGYLGRLERRMEKTQWKHDDPLYVAVREARDVLYALSMHIHYLACGVKSPKRLGAKMRVEGPRVID